LILVLVHCDTWHFFLLISYSFIVSQIYLLFYAMQLHYLDIHGVTRTIELFLNFHE